VVRYDNRFFQLEPQSRNYAPAKGKVVVCEGREGSIAIEYRDRALAWREIAAPARAGVPKTRPPVARATAPTPRTAKRKWVPPGDHPWRQAGRRGAEHRASGGITVATRQSWALPSAAP